MGSHRARHAAAENELDTIGDFGRYLAAPFVIALVTLAAYGAFLAWDTQKDIAPDGSQTGPYETWQVLGLTVALVALVVVTTWRGHSIAAVGSTSCTLTIVWSVQAASDPTEPNLWPVGATFLFLGALCGLSIVASITEGTRNRRLRSAERRAFASPSAG
jgi:hypothetical protein